MPEAPKVDSEKSWKPRYPEKWREVPLDKQTGAVTPPKETPFDPEDPESDFGAYVDGNGNLVVDCHDGITAPWADLFPPAPAKPVQTANRLGEKCEAGKISEDVEVEVTERRMWYREYHCSIVIETSMTWKVTRRKWVCSDLDLPVQPGGEGVWTQPDPLEIKEHHWSRKTTFSCC